MATILAFRASSDEATKAGRRKGRSAEIVIFPGVRYERWPEPAAKKAEAQPKASSRDALKLVD